MQRKIFFLNILKLITAEEMHDMNKSMQTIRQEMEQAFKSKMVL